MPRLLLVLLAAVIAVVTLLAGCGEEEGDPAAGTAPEPVAPVEPVPGGDDPAAGIDLATVAVTVDGREVGLEGSCAGADGAVIATAADTDERFVLVGEEGPALRVETPDGAEAETDEVDTTDFGGTTRYEGTVDVGGEPMTVAMEIAADAEIEACG